MKNKMYFYSKQCFGPSYLLTCLSELFCFVSPIRDGSNVDLRH